MLTIALFICQCLSYNKIRDFKNNTQTEGLRTVYKANASRPTPLGDVKGLLHYSGCGRSVS